MTLPAPNVPPREAFREPVRLRTRWSDEDTLGVLNNAVYLTLLEEARLWYFERLGVLDDGRFPFVLALSNVRFVHPGRGGVEVEVAIKTTRIGTTSLEQAYRIAAWPSGTLWCEAEALLVGWDPNTREKSPLPDVFRARIEAYEATGTTAPPRIVP